jgi:hypothetical protein
MSEDKVRTKDSCWSVGTIYDSRELPGVSTAGPRIGRGVTFIESIAKTNIEKITKEILEGLSEDTDDSDSYDVESGGEDSEDRPW